MPRTSCAPGDSLGAISPPSDLWLGDTNDAAGNAAPALLDWLRLQVVLFSCTITLRLMIDFSPLIVSHGVGRLRCASRSYRLRDCPSRLRGAGQHRGRRGLFVGLKWPPAALPSGDEQSPNSCIWNPCLPGVRPVTSATIFTSLPDFVNVTVASTLLPWVGCRTAMALVGSSP